MTRGKKLIVLAVLVAVLVVLLILVSRANSESEAQAEAEANITFLDIPEDSVTAISWTYDGDTITFVKNGDNWEYAEDPEFPLNTTYINSMLTALSSYTASRQIDEPDSDFSVYGLAEPQKTVTVTADTETVITFGDTSHTSYDQYCSKGDGKIYLVDDDLMGIFDYSLLNLVKTESIPYIYYIDDVTVETPDHTLTLVRKSDDDGYTWYVSEDGNETELDTDLTDDFISEIKNVERNGCVNYKATDEELSEYGLADPEVTVTFNYKESADTDEVTTLVLKFDPGYIRIGDSNMVYAIDEELCGAIEGTTAADLTAQETEE